MNPVTRLLAISTALLLFASGAHAGIIVTEGDSGPDQYYRTAHDADCPPIASAPGDAVDGGGGEGLAIGEKSSGASTPKGKVRDNSGTQSAKTKAPAQGTAVGNLDEAPEGWSCQQVMPGFEMCEPERAQGAAAGAAGGGAGGDAVALDGPQAGCAGTTAPTGALGALLAMLALLGQSLLRRREAAVAVTRTRR